MMSTDPPSAQFGYPIAFLGHFSRGQNIGFWDQGPPPSPTLGSGSAFHHPLNNNS